MNNEEINKKFKEIQLLKENNKNVDKEIESLFKACEKLIEGIIANTKKDLCYSKDDREDLMFKDLMQEGTIGLYNAINSYNPEKDVIFTTYAGTCIKNKILDYIRRESNFQKNIVHQKDDDCEYDILSNIKDPSKTPEEELIEKEEMENIMSALNDTEKEIFNLYVERNPYNVIAKKLNISSKKVDNTIRKIKKIYKNMQ
jgi:RNA polymerase sporulation-specific sigma factor